MQRVWFGGIFFRGQPWQRHDFTKPMRQPSAMGKDSQDASAGSLGKLWAANRQPRRRAKERDDFPMPLNIAVGGHNHDFITT